jgi:hypothetical protein
MARAVRNEYGVVNALGGVLAAEPVPHQRRSLTNLHKFRNSV